MMKPVVAVVEWYGPYSDDEARSASFDYDDGVYVVLGKTKYGRASHVQYIGLASDLRARINGYHHKLPLVTRDRGIWLGEVVSPRTPGRKIKVTDRMLDLVEWAHAYFLQLPLNERKKVNPPSHPITVYNRWWHRDFKTPYKQRPHRDWPDIIDFLGNDYDAKLVWFGIKQIVRKVSRFKS
jgi:hypothetical protein